MQQTYWHINESIRQQLKIFFTLHDGECSCRVAEPMPGKRFYVIYNRLNSFSPCRDSILQLFNLLNRWSVSLLRLPPLPLPFSPSCRTLCTPRDDTFLFNLNSCSQIMQQIFFSAFRCVLEDFLCLFHTWEKITSSDEQESRVEWFVIELRGTLVRLFALRSAEVLKYEAHY